jgi:hypothetical protein
MIAALAMYVVSKFQSDVDIHVTEIASVAVLGWVFLTARDTLLEGIFMNLFKIKN